MTLWRKQAAKLLIQLKEEAQVYRLVAKHPRTPRLSRWLLTAAIGYAISPIDLIPDFIPVIGHLDDAVIVPGLVVLAMRSIPDDVVRECRSKIQSDRPNSGRPLVT